jgi:hypothetical protein
MNLNKWVLGYRRAFLVCFLGLISVHNLTAQKNYTIQWLHLPIEAIEADSNSILVKPDLQGLPPYTVLQCHASIAVIKTPEITTLAWGQVTSILGSPPEFRFNAPVTQKDFIGFWGLVPDDWRDWQGTPAHILARYQVKLTDQNNLTILDPAVALSDPMPAQSAINNWCKQQEDPLLATAFTYHLAQIALDHLGTTLSIQDHYETWLQADFEPPTTKSPEPYDDKVRMSGDGLAAGADDLNAFRDPCPMTLSINSGTLNGMPPNAGLAEWAKRLPCYSDSIAFDTCSYLHFERYAIDIYHRQGQLAFGRGYDGVCDELLLNTTLYWPIRRLGLPTRLLTKIETPTDLLTYSEAIKEPWQISLVYAKPYGSLALQLDQRLKVSKMILSHQPADRLIPCY